MLGLSQALLLSVYAGVAFAKTVTYDFSVGYVTVSTLFLHHREYQ
jgi:iron transport multicopper oxidase